MKLLTRCVVLQVAGSEEDPTEAETLLPTDVSSVNHETPIAQDRSDAATLGDEDADNIPEDQIAVESVDRDSAVYAPPHPVAIPVPLPVPVSPGTLVLPGLPRHPGYSHRAKAKEGGGHRPFGPPKRSRPPFRPPPPPPGYTAAQAKQPSAPIYKVPPPPPRYPPPPPPPPPQPTYSAPPPPQPTYSGPPPAPPKPTYAVPPPPPRPAYSAPPPPVPDQGYGAPKPVDVFQSAGASTQLQAHVPGPRPVIAPPPAPAPGPAPGPPLPLVTQTSYVPPPPPNPTYSVPPAPVPGPAQTLAVGHSISDIDVSGSANSYVPPESLGPADPWPAVVPEMPKITALDVKCEKNLMKVSIAFDKPFYGIVFSKGHYSNINCVHLPAGLGRTQATFDVSINACGTTGNTENGLYGYGSQSGSGTYFENIIVVQYDPQVQEVWDQARKLRCTWHDQYEKSVTFRPFPVDMLDVVRADFAGDNVGCWMQIQVGKGPWASEVSGLVKIGQTMTMVLAIKDDDNKFDMLVRNCMAHDGKRAPIQLVDQRGCVTRPKLMSRFTKIKNFGSSASVLSYAHFQAFKFPDSMEVHFQCTIQICRYQCPSQCSDDGPAGYEAPPSGRAKREVEKEGEETDKQKDIGVNRVIQVVSTRDLTFVLDKKGVTDDEPKESVTATLVAPQVEDQSGLICMSTPGFAATLIVLLAILIVSCLMSAFLCLRFRGQSDTRSIISSYDNPAFMHKKGLF